MLRIFDFVGGLCLFIYGIHMMGEGLRQASGMKLKKILKGCTKNIFLSVSIGALLTALIQSSSATSVLCIGFVNAGLMSLQQTLGIILGANIGTTITSQLIAFKMTRYCLLLVTCGFLLYFVNKSSTWKNIGYSILGCGILFLGMGMMGNTVAPLATNSGIQQIFIKYSSNIFIAFLIGLVATAVFQSSSCTTGVIITLCSSGLLTLSGAIPMIFGCNTGTCVTAGIASIGTSRRAKQVALAHILFNVISSLLFLVLVPVFYKFAVFSSVDVARQCANVHTLFNIMGVALFIPFNKYFARLVNKLLPDKETEDDYRETKYLETHLLNTPSLALEASIKEILRMLKTCRYMVVYSAHTLLKNDKKFVIEMDNLEDSVDYRREAVTTYLEQIIERSINHEESMQIAPSLHVVNDVERIADHTVNIVRIAVQKIEKKVHFSQEAESELKVMYQKILKMVDLTASALCNRDITQAKRVLAADKEIDTIRDTFRNSHKKRLQDKGCNFHSGVIFLEAIQNFEKIGDYLKNIGEKICDGLQ